MSWRKVKIGDFLKRSKIPVDIEDEKQYKRVTIRINHNGVSLRDVEYGRKIGTKKQFILKKGQFILSKIDARYGAFGIAPKEVDGAIITGNFWAYEVDFENLDINWFNQFTNSSEFYDVCERASSGITHRKYLNEEFFLNYEIYLPDIYEQQNIVQKVKVKKDLFYLNFKEFDQQLQYIKQLRQAFLREAMQGQLVLQDPNDEPTSELLKKIKAEKELLIKEKKIKKEKHLPPIKEEEIPFEIPKNWVWCRLGEIIVFGPTNGYSPKASGKNFGVKCLTLTATTSGFFKGKFFKYIDEEIAANSYLWLIPGDILLQRGNSLDYVGIAAIYKENGNKFIYPDLMIKIRPSSLISGDFIHKLLISPFSREYFQQNAFGAQKSMPKINQSVVVNSLIPLPPLAEQKRIVAKLEELMQYCDGLEQSIIQSKEQAEKLLQVALREALKVPEKVEV